MPEYKHSAEVRKFVRDKMRRYRARKKAGLATPKRFKPAILRVEKCSLCYEWHPTQAILPSGHIINMTLDRFHKSFEVQHFKKMMDDVEKVLDPKDPVNALNRCIQWQMEEEGVEDEQVARENCELLFEDPERRARWDAKLEHENMLMSAERICIRGRMELYHEDERTATANCKLLLEDPLYRHMPPGLIPPIEAENLEHGQMVTGGSEQDLVDVQGLMTCFYQKTSTEEMDPEEAMIVCVREMFAKKGKPTPEERMTVGDTFGMTKEQILKEQAAEKKQDGMTIGNLFGKTRKELLEEQRQHRDVETSPSTSTQNLGLASNETLRSQARRRRETGVYSSEAMRKSVSVALDKRDRIAREENARKVKASFERKVGLADGSQEEYEACLKRNMTADPPMTREEAEEACKELKPDEETN